MNSDIKQHTLILDEDIRKMFMPITTKDRERILTSHTDIPQIKVWKRILIEGYETYLVYKENSIPFSYETLDILSKDEAIAYVAIKSIKNPNVNPERKQYCVGKLYEALKKIGSNNLLLSNLIPTEEDRKTPRFNITRWYTAKLSGYPTQSLNVIYRLTYYSTALDNIYRLCPALANEILNGGFYISHNNLMRLSVLSEDSLKTVYRTYDRTASNKKMHKCLTNLAATEKLPKKTQRMTLNSAAIKQMPKYDPDADFSSATFTIRPWINQLEWLYNNASFSSASNCALTKLKHQLINLCAICQKIILKIEGEYYE